MNLFTNAIFLKELEYRHIKPADAFEFIKDRETLNNNLGMRFNVNSIGSYSGLKVLWYAHSFDNCTFEDLSQANCEFY